MVAFKLLTFATPNFRQAQDALAIQAQNAGFISVIAKGPADFAATDFAKRHADLATRQRGAGYWLWKPYYILDEIEKLQADEVLVYSDVGRGRAYRLKEKPVELGQLAMERGFLIGPKIPQHGPISKWTKRDCIIALGADNWSIISQPMIQATWSLWTKSPKSIEFARAWLDACCNPGCLTDDENVLGKLNYDEFVDHRHDQSILSILSLTLNAPVIDLSVYGVYKILMMRPNSSISHTYLKSISNVEDLLSGKRPTISMLRHYLYRKGIEF